MSCSSTTRQHHHGVPSSANSRKLTVFLNLDSRLMLMNLCISVKISYLKTVLPDFTKRLAIRTNKSDLSTNDPKVVFVETVLEILPTVCPPMFVVIRTILSSTRWMLEPLNESVWVNSTQPLTHLSSCCGNAFDWTRMSLLIQPVGNDYFHDFSVLLYCFKVMLISTIWAKLWTLDSIGMG